MGTQTIFLPSPIVARKVSGSNPRFLLAAADNFIELNYRPSGLRKMSYSAQFYPEQLRVYPDRWRRVPVLVWTELLCTVSRKQMNEPVVGLKRCGPVNPPACCVL